MSLKSLKVYREITAAFLFCFFKARCWKTKMNNMTHLAVDSVAKKDKSLRVAFVGAIARKNEPNKSKYSFGIPRAYTRSHGVIFPSSTGSGFLGHYRQSQVAMRTWYFLTISSSSSSRFSHSCLFVSLMFLFKASKDAPPPPPLPIPSFQHPP